MKDFKKFIISVLTIIIVIFIIDALLGYFLNSRAVFVDQPKYKRVAHADEELVILGASRAQNHYVSKMIEDSLGMTTYNYGIGAQNVYTNYALLNLLINKSKSKPRVIIWDFYYIDIINAPRWNTEKLHSLYSAYCYDDSVRSVVNLQGVQKTILLNTLQTYKFNSKLQRCLHKDPTGVQGYVPKYVVWNKPIAVDISNRTELDSLKIEYIDRFISLCKKNDIKLIVCDSPGYYILDNPSSRDWTVIIEKICKENNIPFLNYEQDSTFLAHQEWFYNSLHLNDKGANEFTKRLIPDLRIILKNDK